MTYFSLSARHVYHPPLRRERKLTGRAPRPTGQAGWELETCRRRSPQGPARGRGRPSEAARRARKAFTAPARRGPAVPAAPLQPACRRRPHPRRPRSRGRRVPEGREGARAAFGGAGSGGRARQTPAAASPTFRQRRR